MIQIRIPAFVRNVDAQCSSPSTAAKTTTFTFPGSFQGTNADENRMVHSSAVKDADYSSRERNSGNVIQPSERKAIECVVPKRIRRSSSDEKFDLNGKPKHGRGDYRIDMMKTFGSDSVPPNWKPEAK